MEKRFSACPLAIGKDCPEYDKTFKFCSNRENWTAGDCKALRELTEATLYLIDQQTAEYQQPREQQCRDGDQSQCVWVACNISLTAPVEQIKKCAQLKNLAMGETWAVTSYARTNLIGPGFGRVLNIVCFPLVQFRNPIGLQLAWHAMTQVSEHSPQDSEAKDYFVQNSRFATLDEAAVAACAARAADMQSAH